MNSQHIDVSFSLADGRRFAGEVPLHDVVHLALERLLPAEILENHHLRIFKGEELIYPDMFLHEIVDHYGDAAFQLEARPLDMEAERPFTNFGVDHIALALQDRAEARRFFSEGLGMEIVRDDEHITVVTTGNTALFLFDFDPDAPLAPPAPSRIHHLGVVVDDLEAAAAHLRRHFPEFLGHFTLLERAERLSLYGHVRFGEITFMIQVSQIKSEYRGLTTSAARQASGELYDYASRDYGIRLG